MKYVYKSKLVKKENICNRKIGSENGDIMIDIYSKFQFAGYNQIQLLAYSIDLNSLELYIMMIKNIFLILTFAFICSNNIQAQSTWNKELGIWVNVELDKRLKLNLPFDSTINIIPRFLC